jgi:arylamine N-acetyltransferase
LNVEQYMERIHDTGPLDPSIGTLRRLHRAHMLTVPFETWIFTLAGPLCSIKPVFTQKSSRTGEAASATS